MKRSVTALAIILALTLIMHPALSAGGKDNGWYPFHFPERPDPDSPLNIGKIVLDPPAGKHGFVKVKDGHFYFEDGARAKFWGTNLCFNACFPTHEQAKKLADRIAFFGFNAVRLHHMDWGFEPRGIFEDTNPASKDPQMKKTGILSKSQMDKLDHLIYQLKQRGIYVDINLLVSRHFTEADGIKDAKKLKMAAKPYSMSDRKLIELQKQYARDLLTHYNKYTGLRYCDDPAVALVEIINEATLKDDAAEKKYYEEMVAFLKKDIGVKCPVTGSQFSSAEALAPCDFIDKHAYWDHPKFPGRQWDKNNFTIEDRSALLDKTLGIAGYIKKHQPKDKPYTITEWDHCYPNKYAYETPVLLSWEALANNWDGLFHFAFSHGSFALDPIDNYFDSIANPQKSALLALASLVYLKGGDVNANTEKGVFTISSPFLDGAAGFIKDKPYTLGQYVITADSDCAVFILKERGRNTLFALGDVKNSGSGRGAGGRHIWGGPPVTLKRVNVTVKSNGKTIPIDLSRSPYAELKP